MSHAFGHRGQIYADRLANGSRGGQVYADLLANDLQSERIHM
jgi:hypothetical protein